ncbi:MAG TPA: hypothetical protein VLA82_05375 [Actinomycetota bacterium]|nr:hypothetical protein [Actinomycetota bacterium]
MTDDPTPENAATEDAPTDDAAPGAAPSSLGLRAAGFLLTVAGALIAGIGAMLEWTVVAVPGVPDRLAPTWRGADVTGGKLVLGAAVVTLIAVLTTRVGGTASARRSAAIVALVAALAIVAIAVQEIVTAEDRYVTDAIAEARDAITSFGVPGEGIDEALDDLRDVLDVRLGVGVWLTLVGGIVAVAGGAVTLVWAARSARALATVGPDRAATSDD